MHALNYWDVLAAGVAAGFIGGWITGMLLGLWTWVTLLGGVRMSFETMAIIAFLAFVGCVVWAIKMSVEEAERKEWEE